MRVVDMSRINRYIEVELEHQSGERLHTSFSIREHFRLPGRFETGAMVEVGLLGGGVHWVFDS